MKKKGILLALVLMIAMLVLPVTAHAASVDMADGEYEIEVKLEGGSGRSTVLSPATLMVKDGKAFARIQWSSGNYDYMLVDGEKYLPLTRDPHSVFEIPVTVFGSPMAVTADTTAMGSPHEINYELTFAAPSGRSAAPWILAVCALAAAAIGLSMKKRGKKS